MGQESHARQDMTILLQLDVPKGWKGLKMPAPLQDRLQELLDRQDENGRLSSKERKEAVALTELAEMLSLLKLQAELASKQKKR
jgi:hypothetical protein